ncbi:MAG: C-terminal target protein [Chitinophagaceae bacterium]|nr:C-terminal target protein [Chitinophagaceae bacterium]
MDIASVMKPWKTKLLLHLFLFFAGVSTAMSQLSGTINTYTKVTAVNYLCNFITVNSPTGFGAGDKVLIIQMQGAVIDQTNTTAFGNVLDIADAGNYEFAIIDHFSGNDVYFTKTLLRTYTPSGAVQLVSVPQYGAVSVDAELTPTTWDGNTGGVIVFESSDIVTLQANIDASEKGFTGGQKSPNGGDCSTFGLGNYYYTFPSVQTGQKGQGIAAYVTNRSGGRAKQANGGGGGGSHNTGGGGGGNYGAGGRGGDQKCGLDPYGFASLSLSTTYTTNNKIFMGGGGGGGHVNNDQSYNGGNGGGIIIIKAAGINSNGFVIKSNGGSVSTNYINVFGDNGDGNSGGGAGGAVLLDITDYTASTPVEVSGGKGGNTGYTTFNFGPGGGGGGGVVWTKTSTSSINVTSLLAGGTAGISGSGGGNGSGTRWGAVDGSIGAALNALSIPQSTSTSSCALPVELLQFKAFAKGKYEVQLNWSTATELNNAFFTLEKSTDGIHFSPIVKVAGQETSHQQTQYSFTDEVAVYDLLYYRLWQTDIDGRTVDLGIRKVYPEFEKITEVSVYPNPCKDNLYIPLLSSQKEAVQHLVFVNSIGEMIDAKWEETETTLSIHTGALPAGLYSLIVYTKDRNQIIKVLKEQ